MPNMTVIAPGDAVEVREAVFAATEFDGPVYLRTTRHLSPCIFPKEGAGFSIGRGVRMRGGSDITLIGTGIMTARALEAAARLQNDGIDARVLHLPTLKPIDAGLIEEAAAETGRIITVENHSVIGGLGGAVSELLSERLPVPVHRIGFPDCFGESGDNDEIFAKMGLSVENITAQAKLMLKKT
jgi:transketolase